MKEFKDSIDFGKEDIPSLFRKMLLPTLFGMLFSALFVITDGIFVGWGIGSDALAAINIVAPIFLISTGVGLMFGMGASVIASVHLSAGKIKVARINMTQAVWVSLLLISVILAITLIFPEETSYLFGSSDTLLPMAVNYIYGAFPFLAIATVMQVAGFFVRLSGAPKFAMISSMVSAVLNIILDYLLIFEFKMGLIGAGIATGIGTSVGTAMMLVYLSKKSSLLHFVRIKLSKKSMLYTLRNVKYMCNLGFSSLLCEAAIAMMMICGNYVFMRYIGENGVAAFSIACYFFPLIFMLYTSIAQSAQPIISFNHGLGHRSRVREAVIVALKSALGIGSSIVLFTFFFSSQIVNLFVESANPVHAIAVKGLPLFAIGFVPFAVNMLSIGYHQSVEQSKHSNLITILRGFVFMVLSFALMPIVLGEEGVWLAVPVSESLTLVVVGLLYARKSRNASTSGVVTL
ncbi:MAG: MATE family efflux transporter [Phocaeicola sp.]